MNLKSLLPVLMLGVPAMSSAFSIFNATHAPFTVSVNNICSTAFGSVQIDRETAVDEDEIMNLCGRANPCVARIHELENCTGLEIGSVVFNGYAQVQQSPVTHHPKYSVKVIYYMNFVAVGLKS